LARDTPSIREAQMADGYIRRLISFIVDGEVTGKRKKLVKMAARYRVEDGILKTADRGQVVIPESLKAEVFLANHDHLLAGHLGIRKTYNRIIQKYYWPKVHRDTVDYCTFLDTFLDRSLMAIQQISSVSAPSTLSF
jgi:hypothetical protein